MISLSEPASMRGIRLPFLVLALAIVGVHFLYTDPLRHSRPLELKSLGVGQGFAGTTPELQAEATRAIHTAEKIVDDTTERANRCRLWAGITKWIGIGATALMMMIAGSRGRVITSDITQKPDEAFNLLKEEVGLRRRMAICVGILSASVAAATMVGSQLESEQATGRERAKDTHALLYEARAQLLDATTASQVQDAIKKLDEIRLK
jgi:hypothetical protein